MEVSNEELRLTDGETFWRRYGREIMSELHAGKEEGVERTTGVMERVAAAPQREKEE